MSNWLLTPPDRRGCKYGEGAQEMLKGLRERPWRWCLESSSGASENPPWHFPQGDPWHPASVFNCLVMSLEDRWNVNRVGGCQPEPILEVNPTKTVHSFIHSSLVKHLLCARCCCISFQTQKVHTLGLASTGGPAKPRKVSSVPWGISFSSLEPPWTLGCLDFIYLFTVWRISE